MVRSLSKTAPTARGNDLDRRFAGRRGNERIDVYLNDAEPGGG